MKVNKFLLTAIPLILGLATISSCDSTSKESPATYVNVTCAKYETSHVETNMDNFYAQTQKEDGSSWDNPLDYGFVPSVWHTVTINGISCPAYSTRCGMNIHSFAYINVDTDGAFSIDVSVTTSNVEFTKTLVLPEKRNCETTISGHTVSFKVNQLTDYTLCFGNPTIGPECAITLFFAPTTEKLVPTGGGQYVEITPGTYDDNDETEDIPALPLTSSNGYYYFNKGFYSLNSILIPDNSTLFFEPGCYLEFRQDDNQSCFANNGKSFEILGNAIVDMSKCMGGDAKTKGAYGFSGLESGYVEGLININSHTWTMCFTDCDNIEVNRCMIFGYRTYSDGIMLAGCTNSYVRNNFVRTGDDAIEVKATSSRIIDGDNNLVYEYNSVWTDKGIAYGLIYESNADISGVTFRYNSVGFAQSSWSQHLGCFVIQMGSNHEHTWANVHFEDSEVYYTANQLMDIYNVAYASQSVSGNNGGIIKNIYFKNITCTRYRKTGVDVHALSIIYRALNAQDAEEKLKLGRIYIDNVTYRNVEFTKKSLDNTDLTLIEVNSGVTWNKSNIKVNTLTEESSN